MHRRGAGILLHITSLPSPYGVGDLGPGATAFADFLKRAGQGCWQILPLTPTSSFIGDSPYSSDSAFAGNPLLISPEVMAEEGFIEQGEIGRLPEHCPDFSLFPEAAAFKRRILDRAFERAAPTLESDGDFLRFKAEHRGWLEDFCLFRALKESLNGLSWTRWPAPLRDRDPEALSERADALARPMLREAFEQYLFFRQWERLKRQLAARDILVIGDAPIYVTQDSADVWANQRLFKLGPDREPVYVAGVPPDYFSATGQRWGNPVYDWAAHRAEGFSWWIKRMGHNFRLYDFVRLDHFRGFAGYWEIPAAEKTAITGAWVPGPGAALFKALLGHFPTLPILAEDLGVITPDVRELRDGFGFPGMKVLQFGFGPDVGVNGDAPHNHVENAVVYTGTHDNNTTLGWYRHDAGDMGRRIFSDYLGREVGEWDAAWDMLRLAYMSVARLAMAPLQDILNLDDGARMNTPSSAKGNWRWRVRREAFTDGLADALTRLAELYGRVAFKTAAEGDEE